MTLFLAWLVFPLVLGSLALGVGMAVERLAGTRVPATLLLPVGLAAIVVVSSLAVSFATTARLATPLVAALGAAGLVVGRWRRPDWLAVLAAGVVYLCYAAPVLASGEATFAGYVKLDDTATFLAFTDRVLEHGRSIEGLPPSTYEAILDLTVARGYPLGSVLPLAVGHELVRADAAWLFQPWLAFCAAMLALCLYELAAPLVSRRPVRALVAGAAAQPALLYGFAGWGGVKELAAAALIAAAAALAVLGRPPYGIAALLPLAVASAAVLDTLSLAGAIWLLPPAVAVGIALRRWPAVLAAGVLAGAALAAPAFVTATKFLRGSNRDVLSNESELGNLLEPLRPLQMAGVWPSGDFRVDPEAAAATSLLVATVAVAALAGIALAVRARAAGLLVALASAGLGALVFALVGAPWLAAKAYAMGAPIVLLAALCGSATLAANGLALTGRAARASLVAGTLTGAAIVVGVVWSNALAFHDVNLAPRAQLAELEEIGERFAGQGPALMTEYQPYGVRHFLRKLDPEGASELRRRPVFLRNGGVAAKAEYVDVDDIRLDDLLVYRTLVLRRSPTLSRPPTPYRRVHRGGWYEVWQRADAPDVSDHLPLGTPLTPSGVASCADVRALVGRGSLVAPPRAPNVVASLDTRPLPAGWVPLGGGSVLPAASGTLTVPVEVRRAGRYRVWVGGSVRGTLRAAVDGVEVGTVSSQLQHAGQWLDLGVLPLAAGSHALGLDVQLPRTSPGAGGGGFPLGPLALEPVRGEHMLIWTGSADRLCGRSLDWVEAVAR
jgi:hypothetical protein